MDAGLGTLEELKAFVLPSQFQADVDFDAMMLTIGKGVAERFDGYCNRLLGREEATVHETDADTMFFGLPRYPVESIASLEIQDGYDEPWVALVAADVIARLNKESGVANLYYEPGGGTARIRCTYTGGYWYDKTGADVQPAGSTALPAELKLLWQVQCRQLWESLDHVGKTMSEGAISPLANWELLVEIKNALSNTYLSYS